MTRRIIFTILLLLLTFSFSVGNVWARSGCCSHHGGVCGCGCCDGTSLSATCAPYYPECNGGGSPAPEPVTTTTPTSPVPTPQPTVIVPEQTTPTVTTTPPPTTPTPTPKIKQINRIRSIVKKSTSPLVSDAILTELGKKTTKKVTPVTQSGTYKVASVVDGDTIRVFVDGIVQSVRLLGIDTPETKDPRKPVQCFGTEASKKMSQLVSGKNVKLISDPTQGDKDVYHRLLRYIYLEDGTFVNAEMVKQGYAFSYRKYPTQKLKEFNNLEKQAKDQNLGLWKSCPI